jgi:DNA-binding PadR family transcriptional regulator
MSSADLTPFSYVILALVGEGGAGPHDIVRMMRQGRIYWTAAESHYYAEPKRLEKHGYLRSRKEPGRTRERTHYELTEKGLGALREWLALPARLPRMQNEAVVKVLAADLTDDAVVAASLEGLRADIADVRARLDVAEAVAGTLPHRKRYLRLVHGLGRRLLEAHSAWLEDVERELRGATRRREARRGSPRPSS